MNTVLLSIILIPIIEIYLFIKVGSQIGAFKTILLIFTTAIIGVYYAKHEGLNTLKSALSQMVKNDIPVYEIISGAAIAFALAAILVNIVSKYDEPVTLMFYSNIISVLIMIIPALMFWVTPNFDQLILIFIMAICASIAHNFFIRAYAVGEASVIAPIDYIRLLFSAAVDFLIFGIIFGLNTLIGSAIIILTSLYILRREAKVKKDKEPNLEEI